MQASRGLPCGRARGCARPCRQRLMVRAVQAANGTRPLGEQPANGALQVQPAQQQQQQLVHVAFRWPGQLGGHDVKVSGSWDGWQVHSQMHKSAFSSDWIVLLELPRGQHEYKFLVDGAWKAAPGEPVIHSFTGHVNNKRVVEPNVRVEWPGLPSDEVLVTGDFGSWTEAVPLRWDPVRQRLSASLSLQPGVYYYRTWVNGQYRTSDDAPQDQVQCAAAAAAAGAPAGHWVDVNVMRVPPLPAFHLCYATGWRDCTLVYRLRREGHPDGEWQELRMDNAPSRATPVGGRWKQAIVPVVSLMQEAGSSGTSSSGESASVTAAMPAISMEFWVRGPSSLEEQRRKSNNSSSSSSNSSSSNGSSEKAPEDRGPNNSGYVLQWPGGWKLMKGSVRKFPRLGSPPIMLCSDLDGTMVGDAGDSAADARTRQFADYWENEAALARSILVYNTGRSRGDAAYLLEDKRDTLAVPDVLITAVGTKIWHLPDKVRGFTDAGDLMWLEDEHWAATLDEGWDLNKVRSLGSDAHKEFNRDGAEWVKWLDRGEEHRHRIALQCHASVTPKLEGWLRDKLASRGVAALVIVSGQGDWRYVDVVAHNGGKLKALEWVRRMYGIPVSRCVAAGDSGNDILMFRSNMPAIIVGNAQGELDAWYNTLPPNESMSRLPQDGAGTLLRVRSCSEVGLATLVASQEGAGAAGGGTALVPAAQASTSPPPSSLVIAGAPDMRAVAITESRGGAVRDKRPRVVKTDAIQAAGILEGLARHGLYD